MLFTTLLKKAIDYVEANPIENGCLIIKIEASNHELDFCEFLAKLDPRNLGTLRELVPGAFPRHLRTGPLDVSKNIHGAWKVEAING